MKGDLIKRFEGLGSINSKNRRIAPKSYQGLIYPYFCSAGIKTIGWGHTASFKNDSGIFDNGIAIEKCEELFEDDYQYFAEKLKRYLTAKLNDNQTEALISFCYNLGLGTFRISTLRKVINEDPNNFEDIKIEWLKWNKAGGQILKGLSLRRQAEFKLYMQN